MFDHGFLCHAAGIHEAFDVLNNAARQHPKREVIVRRCESMRMVLEDLSKDDEWKRLQSDEDAQPPIKRCLRVVHDLAHGARIRSRRHEKEPGLTGMSIPQFLQVSEKPELPELELTQ